MFPYTLHGEREREITSLDVNGWALAQLDFVFVLDPRRVFFYNACLHAAFHLMRLGFLGLLSSDMSLAQTCLFALHLVETLN